MDQLLPYISHLLTLCIGFFAYRSSKSIFWIKDTAKKERFEQFRLENGRILRIGGLLLMAISIVNLFFGIFATA